MKFLRQEPGINGAWLIEVFIAGAKDGDGTQLFVMSHSRDSLTTLVGDAVRFRWKWLARLYTWSGAVRPLVAGYEYRLTYHVWLGD